ncbi:MAG: hypothetical protein IAF38_16565 [Bacteroidia bacterium]|nr:hypothetical protein [Bacteroidia bacterium]
MEGWVTTHTDTEIPQDRYVFIEIPEELLNSNITLNISAPDYETRRQEINLKTQTSAYIQVRLIALEVLIEGGKRESPVPDIKKIIKSRKEDGK